MIQKLTSVGEFVKWLKSGEGMQCELPENSWTNRIIRLPKTDQIDYLYAQTIYKSDDGLRRDGKFEYEGLFCKTTGMLYDVKDYTLRDSLRKAGYPRSKSWEEITEDICSDIRTKVDAIIDNDRTKLSVTEITDEQLLHQLECARSRNVANAAREAYLISGLPDSYRCSYYDKSMDESDVLAYIAYPKKIVTRYAEKYIKENQQKILLDFIEFDLITEAYAALIANPNDPIHAIKRIMDVMRGLNAKTVNITIRRDGAEGVFKYDADVLRHDCGTSGYSAWRLPRKEVHRFWELFGRYASLFYPQDIVKITYGKKVLYEAQFDETK